MTHPAGWYPDPSNQTQQRYWDGQTWSEYTQPAGPMSPPAVPVKKEKSAFRTMLTVLGVILVIGVGISFFSGGTDSARTPSGDAARSALPTTGEVAPVNATAGPRDTLTFGDGLTATIVGVVGADSSTNQFDEDGPYTVISIELRNTGSETLDAADWWTPHLNYGPGGTSAKEALVAGTLAGVEVDELKGSGLIAPGGVVTVNSGYHVGMTDLTSATVTPRYPGRLLWTGDFSGF